MRFKATYPFLILLAAVLAFDHNGSVLLFLLAVLIHELGHVLAILACGGRVTGLHATVAGLSIAYLSPDRQAYWKDCLMALAGPAANLLTALLCAAIFGAYESFELYYFIGLNIALAALNMLPALPLDGGRVLLCVLLMLFEGEVVVRLMDAVSATAMIALCAFGVYAAYMHQNFTFLIIGLYLLLVYLRRKRFTWAACDDKIGLTG